VTTASTSRRNHIGGLLFILVFVVLACGCGVSPPPDTPPRLAWPDPFYNQLFNRKGGGWTGGDGTLSIHLPDGCTAWLFGDTFLGHVNSDGTRPLDTPMIRNSVVIQNGLVLETRPKRTGKAAASYFTNPSADAWYWPGDGMAAGNRLLIFLHRFRQSEPRLWGWHWTGTELATLSLPGLELERLDGTLGAEGVMFGVSVLETDRFVYIYGTRDDIHPKLAHLARAPAGSLGGPWDFYTGGAWSSNPQSSAAILSGVSTQYSVIQIDRIFYLITMDGRRPFPDTIVVYRAESPQGPWRGPRTIYRVPGVVQNIVAYNPFVHTQFTDGDRYLVSYNLNHVNDPSALYRDASIYRPRFIRVDFAEVERQLFQSLPGS